MWLEEEAFQTSAVSAGGQFSWALDRSCSVLSEQKVTYLAPERSTSTESNEIGQIQLFIQGCPSSWMAKIHSPCWFNVSWWTGKDHSEEEAIQLLQISAQADGMGRAVRDTWRKLRWILEQPPWLLLSQMIVESLGNVSLRYCFEGSFIVHFRNGCSSVFIWPALEKYLLYPVKQTELESPAPSPMLTRDQF